MKTKRELRPKLAKLFPLTIPLQLYKAWQMMQRKGDPGALCKKLKVSRPVIDNALNYGYVKDSSLTAKISKYFDDRARGEEKFGKDLMSVAESS